LRHPAGLWRSQSLATTAHRGRVPNAQYAQAAANGLVAIEASFVGKTTATHNTHVVGTVVWFPAQSPYSGQHLAALDGCLA
jgi:hypothetical protein